jgi:hypothetical protein
MYGSISFDDATALAEFLAAFAKTGNTTMFEVVPIAPICGGGFKLTFTGGY